jgi:hypothetical protein
MLDMTMEANADWYDRGGAFMLAVLTRLTLWKNEK